MAGKKGAGPGDPKGAGTRHRGDSASVKPHLDARHGKGQRDAGAQDTAGSSGSGSGTPSVMKGQQGSGGPAKQSGY